MGFFIFHTFYYFYKDKNGVKFSKPIWIEKSKLIDDFPLLDKEKFSYAVKMEDGQTNDARLGIEVLLTSTIENYNETGLVGSNIANYMKFINFIKDEKGNMIGALLYDKINEKELKVKCKSIINCTGPFNDSIRKIDDSSAENKIFPLQGSHITLPKKKYQSKNSIIFKTDEKKSVCIFNWLDEVIVGTDEKDLKDNKLSNPIADEEVVKYFCNKVHYLYPSISEEEIFQDVKSRWSGIRCLIIDKVEKEKSKKNVSRDFLIEKSKSGFL